MVGCRPPVCAKHFLPLPVPLPLPHPTLALLLGFQRLQCQVWTASKKGREGRKDQEGVVLLGLPHSPRPPPSCHPKKEHLSCSRPFL